MNGKVFHRTWILLSLLVILSMVVAACAPAPAPVTVKETVEVPVEVVVTPTPAPQPAVYRTAGGWSKPPAYHGNRFAPGGVGAAWWWVYEPLFVYVPASGDIIMRLGASYEEGTDTFTVKLQPNAKWHDGTPVTSKDVWTTLQLRYLQNAELWKYLDSIEMPDDQTVVFKWKKPMPLAKPLIGGEVISSPYHIYGKWADKVDLTVPPDEEPNKSIMEDLSNYKPEFPIGTGPFKVTTVTASEMLLDKFTDHYAADKVHFDKLVILPWPNNEVIWAYLMAGEVDRAHPATGKDTTEAIMARQPKMKLALPSDLAQFGIGFNMRIKPFSDENFRKAIAHAVNRKELREITYYYAGDVDKYAHNVLTSVEEKWLGKDFLDQLTVYDYDPDKAEAMLLDLGYTRDDNGNWLDPEGNPLNWEINCPAGYSDWVLACDDLATQFTEFGIPSECLPIENAVFWPKTTSGDYQVAMLWSAVWWGYAHPWRGFNRLFLGDTGKRVGVPPTLPGPDGEEVNLEDLVIKMGSTFDQDELQAVVQKAAWIANEHMLELPYAEKKLMEFHNYAHVNGWPALDDPIWSLAGGGAERADVTMMVLGMLKPVD
ncbi:MAG: ABC transporter substrate-binding protein [Chloroflexi bacterium]|nr:ABC transporter substrate-binding protein [Chloroflexota bacterium]